MSTTTHQAITTADAPAPVGPYNQAVQAGEWLYCSGQIPLDPATGEMVGVRRDRGYRHLALHSVIQVHANESHPTPWSAAQKKHTSHGV